MILRSQTDSAFNVLQRLAINAVGAIATFGGIWLIYAVMIRPAIEERIELMGEAQRLELIADSHARVFQSHRKIDSEFSAKANSLNALTAKVGQRSRTDKSIQVLGECAAKANAAIVSLQPTALRQGKLSMIQGAKLNLRCNYSSLCQFLSMLHESGEIIWVTELDVKCEVRTGGTPGYGVQKAELTIQIPHSIREEVLQQIPRSASVAQGIPSSKSEV